MATTEPTQLRTNDPLASGNSLTMLREHQRTILLERQKFAAGTTIFSASRSMSPCTVLGSRGIVPTTT
jgi:hypothetical protein